MTNAARAALPTWTKTEDGYRHTNGATLSKRGKAWVLILATGAEIVMPRRATFDHAETAMIRMGA